VNFEKRQIRLKKNDRGDIGGDEVQRRLPTIIKIK
jgi:hypothetical protein